MRATAQTFAGDNEFRLMRNPPTVGELRMKSWRYLVAPASADDPVWVQRVGDFWALQEETYGLRFHEHIDVFIDFEHGLVTSGARVARILPGRRTRDYVAPRARGRRVAAVGELGQ